LTSRKGDNVVVLAAAARRLRDEFLGWQCRIRQIAVREMGGRPTAGMRPRAIATTGEDISSGIVVLLNRAEPADTTKLFRYQVLKTQDPAERYDKAIELLASAYFQHPSDFSDVMTALFGPGSSVAARLVAEANCVLEFAQFGQSYRIPSAVAALEEADAGYQATYWHNRLFNDAIPAGISVLSFTPEWTHASAQRDVSSAPR
jgi:hypothetical protein